MTGNQFEMVVNFEANLKIGDEVRINWTWCHGYYIARGTISKINKKSFRVKLLEEVKTEYGSGWDVGHEIKVPRISNIQQWSINNCVCPIDGWR